MPKSGGIYCKMRFGARAVKIFFRSFIMRLMSYIFALFVLSVSSPAFAGNDEALASPAGISAGAKAHNDEGVAALKGGDKAGAEMHFAEAVKAAPASAELHYNLGLALHLNGKHGDSKKEFQEAKKLGGANKAIIESGILLHHVEGDKPKGH
jgi:Tfp pilus assembly protein PilF